MGQILLAVYIFYFIHSFLNSHKNCFQILAFLSSDVINLGVHICFVINVFIFFSALELYILRSLILLRIKITRSQLFYTDHRIVVLFWIFLRHLAYSFL